MFDTIKFITAVDIPIPKTSKERRGLLFNTFYMEVDVEDHMEVDVEDHTVIYATIGDSTGWVQL